ncbi:hypothetical protein [Tsukamurella ocularis]
MAPQFQLPPRSGTTMPRRQFEQVCERAAREFPHTADLASTWLTARAQAELQAPTTDLKIPFEEAVIGLPQGYLFLGTDGRAFAAHRITWNVHGERVFIGAVGDNEGGYSMLTLGQVTLCSPAEIREAGRTTPSESFPLTRRSQVQLVSLVMSIWALMDSPRTTHHREVLPAARSRGGRRSTRQLLTVDVRPVEQDTTPTVIGHSGFRREHDHRWSVRGHFRNQAYGPGRSLRRRIWIADHVAGPPDKPLRERTGPTVHVVRGG